MTLLFVRGFFLAISTIVGFYVGSISHQAVLGGGIGALSGFLLIIVERNLRSVSVRGLSSMVFGLLLGLFMAKLISDILSLLPLEEYEKSISRVIITIIFSYLGAVMALRGKDEFNVIIPYVRFKRQDIKDAVILLDTSAIIDGRIADIYKAGFLEGRLVVPRFVLSELQKLADSADELKRQKGRRGMELLRGMQKDESIDIRVHEDDIAGEVDSKLVHLAKVLDAKVCTSDHNLAHVANIAGLAVLNLNELANALKILVVAGEELDIRLVKEGKEAHQAVGYLDDGTMVVVAEGKRQIGQKAKVTVSSVLQTQAGRMVFAKLK